jgi:hypothetical protein
MERQTTAVEPSKVELRVMGVEGEEEEDDGDDDDGDDDDEQRRERITER